nr:hypothetical protein [Actinomadura madurae]
MTEPLVVITDSDLPGDEPERILGAAGLRVRRASCRTPGEVAEAARDATALLVQWAPVTAPVLARLDRLRFVSRLGIGHDMIDVAAATARGVAVANTPGYCVEEVAAHTIAMVMALARRLPVLDRAVRDGRWSATGDGAARCAPRGPPWPSSASAGSARSPPRTPPPSASAWWSTTRTWRRRPSGRPVMRPRTWTGRWPPPTSSPCTCR